eukprot:TRINITY_DN29673_c0_g1_i1.p1 TRINITY_DN29673_c0_g1~~TRINITY_DN29673_c0_g1_i1.p1  ORF type:complete len:626 (+),score=325.50 TRINITY_DN29673_c0_g1_i1:56-1933(+)
MASRSRVFARFAGAAAAGFGVASSSQAFAYDGKKMEAANKELFDTRVKQYAILRDMPPLPELQHEAKGQYKVAKKEDVLYPLIEKSDVLMVAGAFFGDEGKGKTVDAIANHPDVACVLRVNSGENAGHTVFDAATGRKYIFHLAPSGLLTPGKLNLVGPECVMDPVSFYRKEVKQLVDGKVDYLDRLFIGNVHVVTPYHKLLDMITSGVNASTLKGMSPVHASKVKKRGIRLDHIFNEREVAEKRLSKDIQDYEAVMARMKLTDEDVVKMCQQCNADGVKRMPDYIIDFAASKDKVKFIMDMYETEVINNPNFPRRGDVSHILREKLANGKKILIEGPQSYWLSNAAEKFWESSTSAQTCAGGLAAAGRFNIQDKKVTVLNIHKAPGSSRVGVGANPSAYAPQDFFSSNDIQTLNDFPAGTWEAGEDFQVLHNKWFDSVQKNGVVKPEWHKGWDLGVAFAVSSSYTHGECGATTRKPRVCGLFDCVAHAEVNQVQGPYLSISALDRGDVYDKIGVIVAYVYSNPSGKQSSTNGRVLKNGDIIKSGDALPTEEAMKHCHPIVKVLPGWKDTPVYAGGSWWKNRNPSDPLPANVSKFISTVEDFTGAKVVSFGNGPKGDQIVYINKI